MNPLCLVPYFSIFQHVVQNQVLYMEMVSLASILGRNAELNLQLYTYHAKREIVENA